MSGGQFAPNAAPAEARVYVDRLPGSGWGRWNGGAHMLANDLDLLHTMAAKIGLRRAWFQGDSTFAHYDLTASKRSLAVAAGAVEIAAGDLPDDVLMRAEDGTFERRCDRFARKGLTLHDGGIAGSARGFAADTGTEPKRGSAC
jgi:hypothetical protein